MIWRVVESVCTACDKKLIGFQLVETMDDPVKCIMWNHVDGGTYRHIIVPKFIKIISQGEVS